MNKIAFKIKKSAEKSILQGHPWVYENSIIKQNKEGKAGDIAIIFNQRKNQFLAIGLYDPESIIRIRVLHTIPGKQVDKDFFQATFEKAYARRENLLETDTTAFRLIYGENDGLSGLIIDIYNKVGVIKLYSEVWIPYLEEFTAILVDLLDLEHIVLRLNRKLQQSQSKLVDGEVILGQWSEQEVVFREHGLLFKANLIKGHKTGYFLDHRHNRLQVRKLSKDKKVLDIFSYAGGFSVNALAGGATEVTSLDISAQALMMAESNVVLNFENTNHKTLAMDAFMGIEQLRREKQEFGLIVVDPPSFAKSAEQIPGAIKSYRRLIKAVLPLIEKGGILLMASCSSRIKREEFYDLVLDQVEKSHRKYEIILKTGHDLDHPEKLDELSYLKSIYLKMA